MRGAHQHAGDQGCSKRKARQIVPTGQGDTEGKFYRHFPLLSNVSSLKKKKKNTSNVEISQLEEE